MALEFLFKDLDQTDWNHLQQGDVLVRNLDLKAVLAQAHPYYADAADYRYFMVLTQSCDLVRRVNRRPRSPYITIAAGRPLSTLVDRWILKYDFNLDAPFQICSKQNEVYVRQLLERLLHNTEAGYFFIKKSSHPNIDEDVCFFLVLSISLRVKHYDACLHAKIAQLDDVFQAKVGWLAGNLYSRVGTPDLEDRDDDPDSIKRAFYEEVLYSKTAWITDAQKSHLQMMLDRWREDNPEEVLTPDVVKQAIAALPDPATELAERVVKKLRDREFFVGDPEQEEKAINILRNDRVIKQLLRGI